MKLIIMKKLSPSTRQAIGVRFTDKTEILVARGAGAFCAGGAA